jgi:hypothetical protein
LKPPIEIESEVLPATEDGVKLDHLKKDDQVIKETVMPEPSALVFAEAVVRLLHFFGELQGKLF